MIFWDALIAVSIVSLLSLLGALFLIMQRRTFEALITFTLATSSGVMLGATFFDILPESYHAIGQTAYVYVITGMISFFVLEKFIHWHHCVEGEDCEEKPVAYLSLIGDGLHNFLDGAVIGIAFLVNIPLGITTTLAVVAHEIPHELGDFVILIYGGFSNAKAVLFNFLSALTAVLGTLVVFAFAGVVNLVSPYLLGFAAGNFLYIAASDLIPELHKKRSPGTSLLQTLCLVGGVVIIWILTEKIA